MYWKLQNQEMESLHVGPIGICSSSIFQPIIEGMFNAHFSIEVRNRGSEKSIDDK